MTEEIWKPVVGYEGLYEVSNLGRVRSLDRYDSRNHFRKGRIMKQSYCSKGYLTIDLCLNRKNKKCLVHRLIAQAFIPNPDNLPEINHKDEDKTNNSVENLEWCDRSYNNTYGTARIRAKETAIKNGYWTGLSEKEYNKKYWNDHRDHLNECRRKNYQENKDKIREYKHQYYQENKDKIREYKHQYYQENKDYHKDYYEKNKEKLKEYNHQYYLKRKAGL